MTTPAAARELLCKPCKGSGVCPRCDVVGQVRVSGRAYKCLACRGSTVCTECRGTGWVLQPPPPEPAESR